jgi:hypothetical protein
MLFPLAGRAPTGNPCEKSLYLSIHGSQIPSKARHCPVGSESRCETPTFTRPPTNLVWGAGSMVTLPVAHLILHSYL